MAMSSVRMPGDSPLPGENLLPTRTAKSTPCLPFPRMLGIARCSSLAGIVPEGELGESDLTQRWAPAQGLYGDSFLFSSGVCSVKRDTCSSALSPPAFCQQRHNC